MGVLKVTENVPWEFHLIIILALVFAFGGLIGGLKVRRREVDDEVKAWLGWGGMIISCIVALIIAFAGLSSIGYEIAGLVLCLSLMLGFLGVGLFIGPHKGD